MSTINNKKKSVSTERIACIDIAGERVVLSNVWASGPSERVDRIDLPIYFKYSKRWTGIIFYQ